MHTARAKRGKTCNRRQALENKQRRQARENSQPVSSIGKHVTGAKRGKTCNRCSLKQRE